MGVLAARIEIVEDETDTATVFCLNEGGTTYRRMDYMRWSSDSNRAGKERLVVRRIVTLSPRQVLTMVIELLGALRQGG